MKEMQSLPYTPPSVVDLITGFVTAVIASWVVGYLFARLYNQFAK